MVSPGSFEVVRCGGAWGMVDGAVRERPVRGGPGERGCKRRGAVEAARCMDVPVSPMMMYLNKYAYDIVLCLRPRAMSDAWRSLWWME